MTSRFLNHVVKLGLLSRSDAIDIETASAQNKDSLGSILVGQGFVSLPQLRELMAIQRERGSDSDLQLLNLALEQNLITQAEVDVVLDMHEHSRRHPIDELIASDTIHPDILLEAAIDCLKRIDDGGGDAPSALRQTMLA